jgi:hypothetical protein
MKYTDNQLVSLAQNNPKELVRLLTRPNADIRTLTFGAEVLGGEVKDESIVLPVFRMLLKHINAVVREGACIGVSSFYGSKKPPQDIIDKLQMMVAHDPSPAIKEYAKGILEDFES